MRGERLGNYLVTEQLGEGGMGTVYAAQHKPPRTLPPGAATVPMAAMAAAETRPPARRTGAGAPRSAWGWRGIGFAAGALALALGSGGVWLARRGAAAAPRAAGPLSSPPVSLTWVAPSVYGPEARVEPTAPAPPEPEPLVAEPPTGLPLDAEPPLGAEPPPPEAAPGSRPGPGGAISSAR